MLKLAAPIIAPSIAKLINYSFNSASFPQRWITAKVFALFKGGDSEDLNNYRPISVLPVLSNVIERHVHDSLSSYLCENNLIYSKQSGFQKPHTTETALIRIIDDLLFNLDSDLNLTAKAFDMVDHVILQDKLYAYGLDNTSLKWFQSYLNDRRQFVSMSDKESTTSIIPHGVPQGSILGPLLFVLFINNLPLHVSSANTDLYADVTTLTCSIKLMDMHRLQTSLNAAVSETVRWAQLTSFHSMKRKLKFLPSAANVFPTEVLMTLLFLLMGRNLKIYNVLSS